jgi:hypothetical protein
VRGISLTSARGTVTVQPEKGAGELGTNTVTESPQAAAISGVASPVTRPICQRPGRGYSIMTTRLKLSFFESPPKRNSTTCLSAGYTERIPGTVSSPDSNAASSRRPR